MLNVTVDEIQRDPSKFLRQVEAGATFLILLADKPIAELNTQYFKITSESIALQFTLDRSLLKLGFGGIR